MHWIKYKTAAAASAYAAAYAYAYASDAAYAYASAYAAAYAASDAAAASDVALSETKLKQANQIREKYPTFQSWIDSIGKGRFRHW